MKRWSWLLAMAMSVSTMAIVGCSGDDDADSTPATTTTVVTNIVGGVTHTNIVVVTNTPAPSPTPTPTPTPTPAVTTRVMADFSQGLAGGSSFGYQSDPIPGNGAVHYTAGWTAIDLLDSSLLDITLSFTANDGILTSGPILSPWNGNVVLTAGERGKIQVHNPNPGTMATVHVRIVWTAE
jgi:hypothetical protein